MRLACDTEGMPKRLSKKHTDAEGDPNVGAFRLVHRITSENEPRELKDNVVPLKRRKNPAAVALGRKGGLKSAAARMEKITPETRASIAQHAARARWRKAKGDG